MPITPLKRSRVNESDGDEDGMDEEEEEEEEEEGGMILKLMLTKIGSWPKTLKQVIHIYCLWFTKE